MSRIRIGLGRDSAVLGGAKGKLMMPSGKIDSGQDEERALKLL